MSQGAVNWFNEAIAARRKLEATVMPVVQAPSWMAAKEKKASAGSKRRRSTKEKGQAEDEAEEEEEEE